MSVKNGRDYLYLIWKSEKTRRQYIVGQLSKNGQYEFQYVKEVNEAIDAGFTPLVPFEELEKIYKSDELFPVFSARLPDRKRKDIEMILKKYGLKEYDSYELLKMSGARLPIDNLQFIDPILDYDKEFERRFYMAGVRHYLGCDGDKCNEALELTRGDEVFLREEPENMYDSFAIRIENANGLLLGYVPRYYSQAFCRMMAKGRKINCHIANVDKNKCCSECILISVKIV